MPAELGQVAGVADVEEVEVRQPGKRLGVAMGGLAAVVDPERAAAETPGRVLGEQHSLAAVDRQLMKDNVLF